MTLNGIESAQQFNSGDGDLKVAEGNRGLEKISFWLHLVGFGRIWSDLVGFGGSGLNFRNPGAATKLTIREKVWLHPGPCENTPARKPLRPGNA